MRSIINEYSANSDISETASATLCMFNMGDWKEFDIVIRCSSSSGFQYNVYGSPFGTSAIAVLVTGATAAAGVSGTDFGAACGTIISTIRNNNLNTFWVEAADTAAAREVSATNVQIIVVAKAE